MEGSVIENFSNLVELSISFESDKILFKLRTASLCPSVAADSMPYPSKVRLTPVSNCLASSVLLANKVDLIALDNNNGFNLNEVPLSTKGKSGKSSDSIPLT